MSAREVGEDRVGPFGVAGTGEPAAHRVRVFVGEWVVPGPHGGAAVAPALMRRADVAERGAVAKDVVPGGRHAATALEWARPQVDVRDGPRAVVTGQRRAAASADDAVGDEAGRRDDDVIGADADGP